MCYVLESGTRAISALFPRKGNAECKFVYDNEDEQTCSASLFALSQQKTFGSAEIDERYLTG